MVTGAVGVAAYEALRKMVVKDQDPDGVFGARFDRGGEPQHLIRLAPLAGNHIGHPHPGAGEGAGLVEHHGVVRATAVGADTALAQIVRLVEQAHSPSRRRRRVDAHRRIRPGREDGG